MFVLPPPPLWPQAASVNASRHEKKATTSREFIDVSKAAARASGGLYVPRESDGNDRREGRV
jgi:hypothetical protein